MGNAVLPINRLQATIQDMKPGDSCWTVPWAVYVDDDMRLWCNGKYSASREPGGTVQLRVTRTAHGVQIDAGGCKDFKWTPSGPNAYVGGAIPLQVEKATF